MHIWKVAALISGVNPPGRMWGGILSYFYRRLFVGIPTTAGREKTKGFHSHMSKSPRFINRKTSIAVVLALGQLYVDLWPNRMRSARHRKSPIVISQNVSPLT